MWDYPRPPAVVRDRRRVTVELGGVVVCDTTAALRVLETSHPPTWYLPVDDFAEGCLRPAAGRSFCEFKGTARYLDVLGGPVDARERGQGTVAARCAWTYPSPSRGYEALTGHAALYPAAVDRCTVAGEVVTAQEGTSTAAGSRPTWSVPSRGRRARSAGERPRPRGADAWGCRAASGPRWVASPW